MATLSNLVRFVFSGNFNYCHSGNVDNSPCYKIMEIPVTKEGLFEIPTFANAKFNYAITNNCYPDAIAVELSIKDYVCPFKSPDAIFKDLLRLSLPDAGLVKMSVQNKSYYIAGGSIFSGNLTPLMMCSWLMERVEVEEGKFKLRYIKPILRIHPYCFTHKDTVVEKFITGKWLAAVLESYIYRPYHYDENYDTSQHSNTIIKVEIEEAPFALKKPDVPSISVTNDELIQTALYYLDEVA